MLMLGPQMGTFSFGPNCVVPSNPPPPQQRCLISARPISRIGLNSSLVGKSWVLDARTVRPRFRCALGVVVDKGVEFSPTFDEYVKVMEAVRTDRSKNSGCNVGKEAVDVRKGMDKLVRSNRGRRGKNTNTEDGRGEKSGETGDVESNASGWGLVGGILEKARAGRNGDERESSNSYGRFEGTGGTADRHFEKKNVRINKYLRSQNGRDGQRVSEHGITNERKEASVYQRNEKLGEMKDVRIEKYLRNQNGRDGLRVSGRGIPNERKEASVYRRYEKLGEMKKAGDDLRPWRQEFGKSDNEELSEKQVEQKGKWARENNNGLTSYGYTYKGKMERNSNGKLGDTTTRGDDYNQRVHKFGYDDNSEEFRKIQVRRSGMRTLEIDDEQNKHEDAMKGGRVWSRPHQPKRDLNVTGKEFLKQQDGNGTHLRFQGNATQTRSPTSGSTEMRGRSGKNVSRTGTFVGRDIYDIDHEDRAAFRTFEVFTDVRNRPRILRMEMEERIEKLAKWLNAKDVNMPEWQFSKMMHSANFKFTDHTILRVVQILGALGNWRRVLQVVEWLHSRERFISYKSRFIYTTVLNVLGKAKRPTEALNIFYAMRKELSSYPDLAAYHCIAVTLGQAGHIKELFDVIDCMRAPSEKKFKLGPLQKWDPRLEPDLVIYNAVLNACVQQKQWEGAFWVLQQLKQCSIKPTNTTYGLAMEVMLACGKYNLVHEFFRKVNKNSVPKALNYKVLVNTLWREGKIDEAVSAVQEMERRGIVGSASLYYDLARCLCSAGRCQEALLQVDKICKVAKKPLVVTYTGLIQACLDSGNIDNAAYIFNQMHKFCSPNTVTCNIMLKSYLEHGMFEEAKELFHRILDGSHDFDSKSSLRQKVIPDKFMFNTMMEACAATDKWDDFENVYRQMLYHGFHFDSKRHLRMVLDAFRAGKVQVMETTWEYLVHSGRVPPPPIIKERFCLKLEEDDPVAAVACIGIHQDNDILAFSEKAWLSLINSSADHLRNSTITRLVLEVNNAQSDSPHPIFQNLSNACNEFLTSRGNLVDVSEDDRKLIMVHS